LSGYIFYIPRLDLPIEDVILISSTNLSLHNLFNFQSVDFVMVWIDVIIILCYHYLHILKIKMILLNF